MRSLGPCHVRGEASGHGTQNWTFHTTIGGWRQSGVGRPGDATVQGKAGAASEPTDHGGHGVVHAIAVEPGVDASITADSAIVAWLLGAFVVTFLVTRAITHLIRAGRGPFRDTTVGGVHI